MVDLCVQRGRGKSYGILLIVDGIDKASLCLLGMVRADADAFSAVDALIGCNNRLAVSDTNCLGRVVLDSVGTAFTLIFQ